MKLQPAHKKILEYLQEYGSANTFKLSRDLKIERGEIIRLAEELTREGLTKFRSGTVIKGDKQVADQKIIEMSEIALGTISRASAQSNPAISEHAQKPSVFDTKEKKPVSKPIVVFKEKIKKEIEDLQTQRGKTLQKISREKMLLCQLRKEKKGLEKSLAVWESSLKQREESVQKKEEYIQKREESVSVAEKKLEREKQRITKARVLKEDINKLEVTLEDLEKGGSIGKEESKQPKDKGAKPKAVSKKIKKPKRKGQIRKKEKHKLEKREEPKIGEQGYEKIGLENERVEDTPASGFENVLETKPLEHLEPAIYGKIRVSKTETDQPKVMPEELLRPTTEVGREMIEDKFHDLIEQEISLLKQRKILEARSIHLYIKDMISEVKGTDQRKRIITDWNRIKYIN